MGRGKTDSTSTSAYTDKLNNNIDNTIFDSKRTIYPENRDDRKVLSFYERYFLNKNNKITITRDPLSVDDIQARIKFCNLVSNYEQNNNVDLKDMSKNELLCGFLDFAEQTNSLVYLKDDAKQFLPYRFLFPDIMKLYIYKMFYPRIFDFDYVVAENGREMIKFKSDYLENNFESIYKDVEFMCMAIIYDAMLIAIENSSYKYITSMKSYNAELDPNNSVKDLLEYFESELKPGSDPRVSIIQKLIPSIIFLAKHHQNVYSNREIKNMLITTSLKSDTFYEGKREDDSRNAIMTAYRKCSKILNDDTEPFTRLLNLYYINKRSYLYDINIMNGNNEFLPYLLDGIITKHHISNMIVENNTKIESDLSDELNLSSKYNNPNCIISNLSSRDYEMLGYIISHTAKSLQSYYLMDGNKDVPPSRICELIDWINRAKYTSTMNSIVKPFDVLEINNVDYDKMMHWRRIHTV